MSVYDKHNNFKESTLMKMTKKELVEYCLMLQKNLIMAHNSHEQHVRNIEGLVESGRLAWSNKIESRKESK